MNIFLWDYETLKDIQGASKPYLLAKYPTKVEFKRSYRTQTKFWHADRHLDKTTDELKHIARVYLALVGINEDWPKE
jgi:hypothetical protein